MHTTHVPLVTPDAPHPLEDFPHCRIFQPALVELVGIEPTTYGLQSRRSPS